MKRPFAKVCNSRCRVNLVEEEDAQTSLETEIDHIVLDQDDDSEPEYGILSTQPQNKRSIVQIGSFLILLKTNRGTPRNLSVMLRSGAKSFYATVDTGNPVSFLNKRTADVLFRQNTKSHFTSVQNLLNEVSYKDFNKNSIKIFGSLTIPISSGGWENVDATFLVSEKKTRCLLGLDLQSFVGIDTIQRNPPQVNTVLNVVENSTVALIKSHFVKKFPLLFTRLSRSKNHQVHTTRCFLDKLKCEGANSHSGLRVRQIKGASEGWSYYEAR